MNLPKLKFNADGLIPAIVQDSKSGTVLMLAYMNEESLQKTIESGMTWFFSRSRNTLWHKGETSGHVQKVLDIRYDCDADTLLVIVEQTGAACHEGTFSCFTRKIDLAAPAAGEPVAEKVSVAVTTVLNELYKVITERKDQRREGSYTCYLFEKGQDKILKKVGEESAETIIASKNDDKHEIIYEMADLWYHCLVLLAYHNITPSELLEELQSRRK